MGSEFTDFVGQVPIALFVWLCGSIIVLIGVLAYIISRRNRRRNPESSTPPTNPRDSQQSRQKSAVVSNFDTGDLPDLEMLVETPATPVQEIDVEAAFPVTDTDLPDTDMLSQPNPSNRVHSEEMSTMTASSSAPRRGTFRVQLVDDSTTEAVEVLTVLRDVVDGGLLVQIGENTYRGLADDPEAKQRFMKVMKELGQIVNISGGEAAKRTASDSTPKPATGGLRSRLAPDTQQDPERVAAADAEVSLEDLHEIIGDEPPAGAAPPTQPSKKPPSLADGRMPGDLPSFDEYDKPLQSGFSLRGRPKKTDIKPVPELNIAEAIEAYLQHKLRHTPEYSGLNLHVIPAQDGGVTIQVGTKFYEAVGDIEEDDVRNFLSQTIQEWQERH